MKKSVAHRTGDFLLMLPTTVALTYALLVAFIVPVWQRTNILYLTLAAAAMLGVLSLCFYGRRSTAVTLALTGALSAAAGVYVLLNHRIIRLPGVEAFIPYLLGLITLAVSLTVFCTARSRAGTALLFAGGSAAFCALWLMGYDVSIPAYTVFLACTVVIFFRRQYLRAARRFRDVDAGGFPVTAAAAVISAAALLFASLTYALTDRLLPVNLNGSRNILMASLQNGIRPAGYSGTGTAQLGGPIKPDNTPVLKVRADHPFYLKGCTYDEYTGSSWVRTSRVQAETNSCLIVNGQTVYLDTWMPGFAYVNDPDAFQSLAPMDAKAYEDYYQNRSGGVRIRTADVTVLSDVASLFEPLKYFIQGTRMTGGANAGLGMATPQVTIHSASGYTHTVAVYGSGTADYMCTSLVPKGSSYTVTYPEFDISSAGFRAAATAGSDDYLQMVQYISSYYRNTMFHDMIISYNSTTLQRYTRLDATVTKRTRDLALSITKNCTNDYEKILAVKSYLSRGFRYTLSPDRVPGGRDFVDYFLFTGKAGYCVHFATAMTELLRAAGVPARYVEGFVSPSAADSGVYTVTENQAHAWVEVYSPMLGWYTVEATPGFGYLGANGGGAAAPVDSSPDSGDSDVTSADTSSQGPSVSQTTPSSASAPGMVPGADARPLLPFLPVLAAALILLTYGVKRAGRALCFRGLAARGRREQVLAMYAYFLTVLGRLGLRRRPDQTPGEFARSLHGRIDFAGFDFERITEIFVAARYGGAVPGEEDLRWMRDFYRVFAGCMRKYAGTPRYLLRYLTL